MWALNSRRYTVCANMAMALHHTHTLWNAVSAGDMVMDGSCTISWNVSMMYCLVVNFHIRATSSPLSALVFMSQTVVYTIQVNVPLYMHIENEVTGFPYITWQVLLVLCGLWSLDVLVLLSFCVRSNIRTVHALALSV